MAADASLADDVRRECGIFSGLIEHEYLVGERWTRERCRRKSD
jgi:hypothetical protein